MRDSFKAATGIEFELMRFSGTITVERIKTEARAGKYVADVFNAMSPYHAGAMEGTGLLKPIDNLPALKDVKDPDAWFYNPILTPSTISGPVGLRFPGLHYTYNTNLVPPERLPKSPQDLLDPWWLGKICENDPITYAGIDYFLWRQFRENNYADWYPDWFYDYYNKGRYQFYWILGGAEPMPKGDCAFNNTWGGSGAGAVKVFHIDQKATWIQGGTFDNLRPISMGSDQGFSLTAKSPHPNAGLVFVNWFYSKDGQGSWAKQGFGTVPRRGVPTFVEEKYWPKNPVKTYWLTDLQWYNFEQYSYASKGVFRLVKEGMSRDTFKKWMKDTSINFWGQYPPPQTTFFEVAQ